MGQHDLQVGEVLRQPEQFPRVGLTLAGVVVPQWLTAVGEQWTVVVLEHPGTGFQHPAVLDIEALAVGAQLAQPCQPCRQAALKLSGVACVQGLYTREADQPVRVAAHRLDDVVVMLPAQAPIAPWKTHNHCAIHACGLHGGHHIFSRGQPASGVGVQGGEPCIPLHELIAPGTHRIGEDVRVKINYHGYPGL